jgi:hypothetical protein
MMHIEFMTSIENHAALPHPVPASKAVPDWYKRLPRSRVPDTNEVSSRMVWSDSDKGFVAGATMKECIPVRDYITSGYIIPLWSALVVHMDDDGTSHFAWQGDDCLHVEGHPGYQTLGTPLNWNDGDKTTLKLASPWMFRTKPGYSCLFFSPRYAEPNIEILPAIVDTDTQHEVNFPFVFRPREDARDYILERGEPLIQILPFKRESWSSSVSAISEGEIRGFNKFIRTFALGGYRRFRHSKKTFM